MIKRLALIFALCGICSAQVVNEPTGAAIYFHVVTQAAGGTFTNADSAPTWTLLKNGTTVVTTGTFTVVGTGTLAADYYGSLTLNGASFSVGDGYAIEATGTLSAIPGKKIVQMGRILPAETNAGYMLVDAHAGVITGISGGTLNVTGIVNSGTFSNTGTLSAGTLTITNGITAATLSTSGAATLNSLAVTNQLGYGTINGGTATIGTLNVTNGLTTGTMSTGTFNISTRLSLGAVVASVSSGDAISVTVAGGNGNAINLTGAGTGAGMAMTAGATGIGLNIAATGSGKPGIFSQGGTSAAGFQAAAGAGGTDIVGNILGGVTGNITGNVSGSVASVTNRVTTGGGTIDVASAISGGSINVTGIVDAGTLSIAGATTFGTVNTGTFTYGTLALTNASNLSLLSVGTATNVTNRVVAGGGTIDNAGSVTGSVASLVDKTGFSLATGQVVYPDWAHIQNPTTVVNLSGTTVGTVTNGGGGGGGASAADIWSYATASMTTSASIGSLLANNVDAKISSIGGAVGPGATHHTITWTNSTTHQPVADGSMWVTTDAAGLNVVAGTLRTNDLGKATFMLNLNGVYYVFARKAGVASINGTQFTATADP